MKYGFVIDNRKCIGCHACTTACKSEHEVPVGVNRTWVKQVEKGTFPNTRRLFSVMRCNHCTDAPCVSICPTEALFTREDGIVDFNSDRCIGCKSCMQACPYDALYIDPETHTAAKCNYCAHRIDIGLEPACVNVCPEEAIISGNMEDPDTKIAKLLAKQPVKVRKPEKGTQPNLFYIDADDISLNPTATEASENFWNSQDLGVGHFAKQAEKMAMSNAAVNHALTQINVNKTKKTPPKSIDVLLGKGRRIYDTPDKGILWGWEVSAYVLTKAIATGAFLVPFIAWAFGFAEINSTAMWAGLFTGLIFLGLTGLLLIKDLDQPKRFLNVLFRPQWKSWLVRGGYAITAFGGLLSLLALSTFFNWNKLSNVLMYLTAPVAVIVSVYTAFLFAQAKGRDFWQSPILPIHMLVHTFMAGTAVFALLSLIFENGENWLPFIKIVMLISISINLLSMLIELSITHPTEDAKRTVQMIYKGRYRHLFWSTVILLGNILPITILLLGGSSIILASAGILVLTGIYFTEHIWIEAPQQIQLK